MPNPTQPVETPLTQPAAIEAPTPAGTPQSTPAEVVTADHSTTPEAARAEVAAAGRRVGRYEVIAELASGGMGVVYEAADRQVNRRVALKMIRGGLFASAEEVKRFRREAEALAQLSHPHIIQVYDFGEADGRPYFTMQLAAGGSLAGQMARFAGAERAAVALIEKVARAVQHAHERGVLHRDLKPANVLLGTGDEPLVSDFGLVKFLHAEAEGLTQTGVTPGTPAYMAPEQALGRKDAVSPRTDVWALGVMLYELLSGGRPFSGQSREEILHRILTTPVPAPRTRRPDVDAALEAVVMKCLAKEPGARYATAGELADDLGRWLHGELRPRDVGPHPRVGRRVRGRPLRTALIAASVVAVVALGLIWLMGKALPPATQETKEAALDPPLILIDANGPTQQVHWITGGNTATLKTTAEGLSLTAGKKTAIMQLLPAPPWKSYRLEARVRNEVAGAGMTGMFFDYAGSPSAQGPCHLLCSVGFADQGSLSGQFYACLCRLPDRAPDSIGTYVYSIDNPFKADVDLHRDPSWRAVALEVRPQGVKLFFDDRCFRSLTADELRQGATTLFQDTKGLRWDSLPTGGLGIYVDDDGAATFQSLVIRPLRP